MTVIFRKYSGSTIDVFGSWYSLIVFCLSSVFLKFSKVSF